MIKICEECDEEFEPKHFGRKFCSDECASLRRRKQGREWRRQWRKKRTKKELVEYYRKYQRKPCKACGGKIPVNSKYYEFCNKDCAKEYIRKSGIKP